MKTGKQEVLAAFVSLTVLSGCAGMVTKVDHDAVHQLKTVAVVGFTYDQQEANTGKTILDNVMGQNKNGPMGKLVVDISDSPHVDFAYQAFSEEIAKKSGLVVLPREKIAQNPALDVYYNKKTATIQTGRTPLMAHFYRFEAANIPQFYYLQFADKAALNELAKSLNVDGLVLASATVRRSQTSVLGFGVGAISSVSDVVIFIYDPKKQDFVAVINATGDEVSTKDSKFMGFADQDEMNIQSLEATQNAVKKAVASL